MGGAVGGVTLLVLVIFVDVDSSSSSSRLVIGSLTQYVTSMASFSQFDPTEGFIR